MTKKYDDASWHYEGDYPEDLEVQNAAIHIGMFLAWCIEMNFASEELIEDASENIDKIKAHSMTGAQFLEILDEKFMSEHLNDQGNAFTIDYYEDSKFSKMYACYAEDFGNTFDDEKYETLYHVEDTWENYKLMKSTIDIRFKQWNEKQTIK